MNKKIHSFYFQVAVLGGMSDKLTLNFRDSESKLAIDLLGMCFYLLSNCMHLKGRFKKPSG